MLLRLEDGETLAQEALVQENLAVGRGLLGVGPVDLAHRPVRIELVDVQVGLPARIAYTGGAPLARQAVRGALVQKPVYRDITARPVAVAYLQGCDAIDGGRVVPGGPVPEVTGTLAPGPPRDLPGDVCRGGVAQEGRAPYVHAIARRCLGASAADGGVHLLCTDFVRGAHLKPRTICRL